MGDGNVATRVGHQLTRIPCLDQLEAREFRAATDAFERLRNTEPGHPNTVRDVDDARQLLQVAEQLSRDGRVERGMAQKRDLW